MPTWWRSCSTPRKGIDEEAEAILAKLPEREPAEDPDPQQDRPRSSARTLLALAASSTRSVPFADTFMISALKGDGLDEPEGYLAEMMPEGPWLYPEDQISDAPAAHARRRDHPREDLRAPARGAALPVDRRDGPWQERPDGSVRIEQTVFVERDSQTQDRARQGRRRPSRRSARRPARRSPRSPRRRCISSCS